MRGHISVHRTTAKYFCNSFVFKPNIEKEGLPRDRTPDLGAGGLEFKSPRPTKSLIQMNGLQPRNFATAALWCDLGTIRIIRAGKIALQRLVVDCKD